MFSLLMLLVQFVSLSETIMVLSLGPFCHIQQILLLCLSDSASLIMSKDLLLGVIENPLHNRFHGNDNQQGFFLIAECDQNVAFFCYKILLRAILY